MSKVHLHRRAVASINMQEFASNNQSSSQTPLLSPVSSSDDDGGYCDHTRNAYGSASRKDDTIVTVKPPSDDDDNNAAGAADDEDGGGGGDDDRGDEEHARASSAPHGGVEQADAINRVWSRGALVTAYFLYTDQFRYGGLFGADSIPVSFCAPSPMLYSGRSSSTSCHTLLASSRRIR